MDFHALFDHRDVMRALAEPRPATAPPQAAERREGAWQVLPLEGVFEIVYEDGRGAWSTRILDARELKLGPGRTLLGGIDRDRGLYRGLRADRIRRLSEPAGSVRIETGILDWLLARAERQRRARAGRQRRAGRAAAPGKRAA